MFALGPGSHRLPWRVISEVVCPAVMSKAVTCLVRYRHTGMSLAVPHLHLNFPMRLCLPETSLQRPTSNFCIGERSAFEKGEITLVWWHLVSLKGMLEKGPVRGFTH